MVVLRYRSHLESRHRFFYENGLGPAIIRQNVMPKWGICFFEISAGLHIMFPGRARERSEGGLNRALREALIYLVLLTVAALIYLVVHAYGMRLAMPTPPPAQLGPLGGGWA